MPSPGRIRDERGAALVEMALCLPVLVALLVGIVSGGTSYSRKISLDTASRDASRYGATLPVATAGSMSDWLAAVANAAQQSALKDLQTGVPNRTICVEYVHPGGAGAS